MNDPTRTLLVALLVTGGVLTWRGIAEGTLTPQTYAALVVVALILIALGSFAGELAAALAVALMVAVLLSDPEGVGQLGRVFQGRGRRGR